jgi:uncharacterized OsmC-like protein
LAANQRQDVPAVDTETFREVQAPLKALYRQDADAAVITLAASGDLDTDGVACRVETGRALATAGLHPATGGDGTLACSGDMLLEALVACAGVTLRAVALAIGADIEGGRVWAEGDLDFRGTLGVSKDAPVGFREVRLHFELDTQADDEVLATLLRLTERYCVVLQTLRGGVSVTPRRSLAVSDSTVFGAEVAPPAGAR